MESASVPLGLSICLDRCTNLTDFVLKQPQILLHRQAKSLLLFRNATDPNVGLAVHLGKEQWAILSQVTFQ